MRINYDAEADALYIQLRAQTPADSIDLEDGVTADLDAEGHVTGLEVLDARKRLGAEALVHLTVAGLPLTEAKFVAQRETERLASSSSEGT
jgi:uncharacterized protein YuzE